MEILKFIKIARILFIAQKVNDIKPYVKLDLIVRQYGKKLKQGKLQQYEKIMQQKYPEKFKKYNDLVNITIGNISIVVNKYLQKNSPQTLWFYHQYIKQQKHIQDILNIDGSQNVNGSLVKILKYLSTYQQYNKTIKKQLRQGLKNQDGNFIIQPQFDVALNDKYSFQNLVDIMQKKQQKKQQQKKQQQQKQQFKAPKFLEQINIPGVSSYKVYKAMGNNRKHFRELHDIDGLGEKKSSARSVQDQFQKYYASWCVVTGSQPWGSYLQSPWNYYYYVTKADNTPYVLMNFGTSSDAQIKNISDLSFNNYDQQMFDLMDYLCEKDNFEPQKGSSDYKAFVKIKKIKNNQVNLNDLNIVAQHGNLQALKQNSDSDLYIYQKNGQQRKPKYLIVQDTILKLSKDSLSNIDLVYLLKDLNKYECMYNLVYKGIISNQNGQIYQTLLNFLLQNKPHYIDFLLTQKKLQFNQRFIDQLLIGEQFYSIVDFIIKGYITDEKNIDYVTKKILQKDNLHKLLYTLLSKHKLPMKYYNKTMKIIVEKKDYAYNCLYQHLQTQQWRDKLVLAAISNDEKYVKQCLPYVNQNIVNNYIKIIIHHEHSLLQQVNYLVSKFDNIEDKNIIALVLKYQNNLHDFSDFIGNDKMNPKYLQLIYNYVKSKNKVKLLSCFTWKGKQKAEDQQNIIDSLIEKRQYDLLVGLMITDKIKDKNKCELIIEKIIKVKRAYPLYRILQSKYKQIMRKDLLLKSIKIILDKYNANKQSLLRTLFIEEIIPFDYGHLFLDYFKKFSINYWVIDQRWNKKYFTLQFIDKMIQFTDSFTLDTAIKYNRINPKYIPHIMDVCWDKQNYRKELLSFLDSYSTRNEYRMPYRQKIFEWLYQNHYEYLIDKFNRVQDKFKPFVLRKLLQQSDEIIFQFVKEHNWYLGQKKSNQIYERFKNSNNWKYMIYIFRKLSEENKIDLMKKIFINGDLQNIDSFFSQIYNYSMSQKQENTIVELINTIPIQKLTSEQFLSSNNKLNSIIIHRIINEQTNAKKLYQFYNENKSWCLGKEQENLLNAKLIELCKNKQQLKGVLQKTKSINKLIPFLQFLFDFDADLFVPMVLQIDENYMDYYLLNAKDKTFKAINIIEKLNNDGRYDQLLGVGAKD